MTQTAHKILRDALGLAERDRAALAGALIESLDTDPDSNVENAWLREVNRRLQELDSGQMSTLALEDVLSDISKTAICKTRG